MVAIFYNFSLIVSFIFLGLYFFALYTYNVYFLIFAIFSLLLVLVLAKRSNKPINMIDIIYKMVLIKLIFFMVYLYTNGIYCGSDVNKIMLQTATKVTVSAGMSPNQSQGFLGTIGGMTLFFGSTYMAHKLLLKLNKEPEVIQPSTHEMVTPNIVEEVIINEPLPKKEPTTVQEQIAAHIKNKQDVIEFEKNYVQGVEAKISVYDLHAMQFNKVPNTVVHVISPSEDGEIIIEPSKDMPLPDNIIHDEFFYKDQFGKTLDRIDHLIELNTEMRKLEGVNLKSAYYDINDLVNIAHLHLQKLNTIQIEEKKMLVNLLLQRKDSIIDVLKNDPTWCKVYLPRFYTTLENIHFYSHLVEQNRILNVSEMFKLQKLENFLNILKQKQMTFTRIYSGVEAKDILMLDEAWKYFCANKTYYCALWVTKLFYCAVHSEPVPSYFDDNLKVIILDILKQQGVSQDLKYVPNSK